MKTYYNKKGKVLGQAWSVNTGLDACQRSVDGVKHEPHPWQPPYAAFGPYMCVGWPKMKLYDIPPRRPVN